MAEKASRMGTDLSERLPVPADPDFGLFTIRLNELLGRVSSSALLQERFVADAAHELRTPLAIILGGIDSILQKPRQAEEYLHTLEQMQHETARLSSLVEMLLLTAESTKGEATVTDLSDSLEQAHARWVDQFVSKKVELELVVNDLLARIEPQEIQVVLDNLLANALKFSPSGSSCEIALEREAPYAKIIVSDEGPGVPSELSDQIFDRFVRNSSARSRDGFGIGLSICRRIIESRGGTISLDTAYSKGSRFVIRLQESYLQEF
jgi:signal transduction histidine kinase